MLEQIAFYQNPRHLKAIFDQLFQLVIEKWLFSMLKSQNFGKKYKINNFYNKFFLYALEYGLFSVKVE